MSSSSSTTTTTTKFITTEKLRGTVNTSTPKESYSSGSFISRFARSGNKRGRTVLTESAQNDLNSQFEITCKLAENSLKNKSVSSIFNESAINTDLSAHPAYLEYKLAGEYWEKTPKTDYTYSYLSPHRRPLTNGYVGMPNMSRRSIYTDQSSYYDSADEVDYLVEKQCQKKAYYNTGSMQTKENWLMRLITIITTITTTTWDRLVGTSSQIRRHSNIYTTDVNRKGVFASIGERITSTFRSLIHYTYLSISNILCMDTWLLRSSNVNNKGRKRFLLFLLCLLPLLLLIAWRLFGENEDYNYLRKAQLLLPSSFYATLGSRVANIGNTLKDFFSLSAIIGFSAKLLRRAKEDTIANIHIEKLQQNMKNSLSAAEYENILNHINSYVQQLLEIKLKEERLQREKSAPLTPQQMQIIVKIMHENFEQMAKKGQFDSQINLANLSEDQVQHLAGVIQLKLEAAGWSSSHPVRLTAENLKEITEVVKQQINVNKQTHLTYIMENIDLNALLGRLLSAPELAKFVDARINVAIDEKRLSSKTEGSGAGINVATEFKQQLRLIDELNNQIAFIKLSLSDKLGENEELQNSLRKLKGNQDDLLIRLQEHELLTDKRLSGLLAEIESKFSALQNEQFKLLNQQVKLSLIEILGFKQNQNSGVKFEEIDLQNWVRNTFVAKDYLEKRLEELNNRSDDKIRAEIDRSGMLLMRDISERLKREIILTVETRHKESADMLRGELRSALSEQEVRKIVKSVLAIYDADKTGLVDFALESAGGQILSTRCTESYQTKSAQISVFGIPLWYPTNTPRVAISPNVQPGECWAFQGFPGFLVLKLNSLVYITGFTLEHIPKTLSPTAAIESAPRNFTVWGLEHEKDQEPVLFGEYEYVDNDASLQYFPVQNLTIKRPYEIVELRIESNHGNPQYTCLYRFRVHGKPPNL
ncbi:uncharacterized protein LOC119678297 isoform X2 [Teleopsis dalmanni]|nr:uncharacterized protein LOC119678297 isoform X2 [Teleopsis dalmanni]